MRNFEVRNDGPPDYEWLGSFDNFQTEFSISQLVEEKFTSTNNARAKPCASCRYEGRTVHICKNCCPMCFSNYQERTASPVA